MSRDEYAGLLNHQPEAISSRHGKLLRHLRFVYVRLHLHDLLSKSRAGQVSAHSTQREAPRNDKKRGR